MKPPSRRDVLGALPEAVTPVVRAILAAAESASASVLLVGGPVRDHLLGRGIRDVDLIVEPYPDGAALELARAAAVPEARVVSHGRFGTVRIEAAGGTVDLATVRSESYPHPGALPKVAPGSLADDLVRRDFSVNALAVPLSPAARRAHAALVDPGSGLRDLERGLLRVFHNRSFHDDPTRGLRAARLSARLDFRLTRGSHGALRDALRDGAFGRVSGERYRREIDKLFADAALGQDPSRTVRRLHDWHVLPGLEPGLQVSRETLAALRRLGRSLADAPWPRRTVRAWAAGLAVWLAPCDATLRRRTLTRLAVRGETAKRIAAFPRERDQALRALQRSRGRGATDAALARFDDELLLALHAWAEPALRRRIARFAAEDRHRRLPLTGADLVAAGLDGPAVGRALARIRTAFLDGSLGGREEALALARELARRKPRARRAGPDKG